MTANSIHLNSLFCPADKNLAYPKRGESPTWPNAITPSADDIFGGIVKIRLFLTENQSLSIDFYGGDKMVSLNERSTISAAWTHPLRIQWIRNRFAFSFSARSQMVDWVVNGYRYSMAKLSGWRIVLIQSNLGCNCIAHAQRNILITKQHYRNYLTERKIQMS